MKITFVCPFAALNGGTRVVATYARLLQARGHEVTVVSQPKPRQSFAGRIRGAVGLRRGKQKIATPLLEFLGPRHIVLDMARPVEADDLPDADVVVATFWITAEWVAGLPASKGRKFYLLQDYEVFPYLPVDRVKATFGLPLKKIAVSTYIRSEVQTNHGSNDIEVVHNSVDLEQFETKRRSKPLTPTVGFLYTSMPRKNISLAIAAIRLAKERLPNLRAEIFGAMPLHEKLPLPDWVTYHRAPRQNEIPKIYGACDAWLFTSEKEGFGLPILEAMACRTPVLATRAGAAPDLIDGTNGTLLSPTPEAFADEILRFAQMSQEEWLAYSDAAHRTATGYTWQDATDRLLEIFSRPELADEGGYDPKQAAS